MSAIAERRAAAIAGRRILLTRDADDARRWAHRLRAAGAVPIVFPCITCEPMDDDTVADRLRAALAASAWVVFSSVRGVELTANLLERTWNAHAAGPGAARRGPTSVRYIAVVGPSTAMAASLRFGRVDLVGRRATSAALGADLATRLKGTGQRVLVVGAEGGRADVEFALDAACVPWTRVDVYRTLPVPPAAVRRDLGAEGVQDILLASPSAVTGLCNAAVIPPDARIVTIGSTTTNAARAAGLTVWAEAGQPSLEGMLEALQ